jgi:hypothetical protein
MQMKTKLTSHQKIVAIMANNKDQEWFFAKDIINQGEGNYYVGYEATARMSELVRKFPNMFESQGVGKYIKRRIRWEELTLWFSDLPTEYRHIIHKAGRTRELRKNPHEVEEETKEDIPSILYKAEYIGRRLNLKHYQLYEIMISKLTIGQPISVIVPELSITADYKDVNDFKKDWRVK